MAAEGGVRAGVRVQLRGAGPGTCVNPGSECIFLGVTGSILSGEVTGSAFWKGCPEVMSKGV